MKFHFQANQSHFHNGFALRLALKQRHKETRKWPIQMREFDGAWERGRHNRVKIKGLVYKRMANSLTSGSCPV